ncbi:STAS domain-containing protein [Sporosarcina koreensis]|uniref:STAS domain-containing protein n=1 Tax=Sporosarcina koreensis TaxID=334735 RepID=UPI000590F6FA|nr:STAS domain-containing protein [Sporosarcina koreensis]
MSYPNPLMPLPMYTIDTDLQIVRVNQAAATMLAAGSSILDVIESESRRKVERRIRESDTVEALEVNVLSPSGSVLLADLYASWTEEPACEVVIVKKDQAILKVSEQLTRLRTRLTETDFQLLEAKESAETLLQENIKLSSPFIELTDTVAVVPIFGDLDEEKSSAIARGLTERSAKSGVQTIILDFTAVGRIEQDGLYGFEKLIGVLELLGFSLIVTGLNPLHVKVWNQLDFTAEVRFVKTLKRAIAELTQKKTQSIRKPAL